MKQVGNLKEKQLLFKSLQFRFIIFRYKRKQSNSQAFKFSSL